MDDRLIVTASPHIRDNATTRGLMGNVLIALVPSIVASGLIFGMRAILLTAVTTLACVVFEYLYCKLMHKPNPVGDLSACVTGVILALNMPVSMPLWIAIVGALVAIVIIKQLFGGLGYNFANPALVGRIVLFLGFTSRMTAYVYPDMSVDALASATPLNAAVDLHSVSFVDMLLGIHGLVAPGVEPRGHQVAQQDGEAHAFVHAGKVTDQEGDQTDEHAIEQLALGGERAGHIVGRHEHGAEQQAAGHAVQQGNVRVTGSQQGQNIHSANDGNRDGELDGVGKQQISQAQQNGDHTGFAHHAAMDAQQHIHKADAVQVNGPQ